MDHAVDPLDTPAYSPATAGRLTGLSADRVRRWLHGYEYTYEVGMGSRRARKAPVISRNGSTSSRHASFLDLIDLLFVKQFLDHGISLQRLRKALQEAKQIVPGHHFAQRVFFTDGHKVYLKVKDREAGALIELLSNGQWVIAPIIEKIAHQVDFEKRSGFAQKWYPAGRDEPVVIDPRVAFGAPAIVGRGITTANIFDMYEAECENIEVVCDWMGLEPAEAASAVRFERRLAA